MARLRDDDGFRARVRAAVELKVPLSVFLGRAVEPGDPLWLNDDRDAVLAWNEYRDSLCDQCGNPTDICHDQDLDGELFGVVKQCHFSAAVARTRKREWDRFKGQASDSVEVDLAGTYVAVYRRDSS